jgi:hypothetical protein
MTLTFNGDGANDFQGEAAAVLAQDDASVTIENSYIKTAGVIRTAAAVKENGIMNIKNSVIYTEETADTQAEYDALVVPMMKRTPFALGIEGVVRATNVLGSGQGIYRDSLIVSSGWGVLSTDSGTGYDQCGTYALDVENVTAGIGAVEVAQEGKSYDATKEVNGVKYGFTAGGSGYVAYADSGVYDKFNNVTFVSDDYIQIMASSTSSAFYTNSTLTSGRIAVMTQQNNGGLISIKDSTVNAEDTVVQIKSGAANAGWTNIVFDNATINLGKTNKWGGTLVELVESDDAGNPGNTSYTVNDTGDTAEPGAVAIAGDTYATLKNGTYTGNIWNNIYNNSESLNVTIDAATVNGTISSSYGYHVNDDGTRMENGTVLNACTSGDYRTSGLTDYAKIGAQYNVANKQVNNPVNVTLTNNSTWNVVLADGTNGEATACYINDLTVEEGSTIDSATPVTLYVYGDQDIKGTVGANITIEKATVDASTAVDDGIAISTQFYDGTPFEFVVKDTDGNLCKSAVTIDGKAFTNYGFNVTAAEGYTVESVVSSDNGTVTQGNADGYAYTLENKEGNKDKVTVTVTVKASEAGAEGGEGMPGGDMAGGDMAGGDMGGGEGMPGAGDEATSGSYSWDSTVTASIAHKLAGTGSVEMPGTGVETPSAVKLAKVKGVTAKSTAKKTVKVSYKKVAKAASYKIQLSTSKKFTKATTKTVSSKKLTKTVKGLKSGKKYYVRVQAVKGSTTGAYSAVKNVKVK